MYVRKNYSEHIGRNNRLNFFFVKLLVIVKILTSRFWKQIYRIYKGFIV